MLSFGVQSSYDTRPSGAWRMYLHGCGGYVQDIEFDNITLTQDLVSKQAGKSILRGTTEVIGTGCCQLDLTSVPCELMGLASLTTERLSNIADDVAESVYIDHMLKAFKRNVEARPTCVLRQQANSDGD